MKIHRGIFFSLEERLYILFERRLVMLLLSNNTDNYVMRFTMALFSNPTHASEIVNDIKFNRYSKRQTKVCVFNLWLKKFEE